MADELEEERLILEELHEDEKVIHEDEKKIKIAFFGIGILFIGIVVGIFYFTTQLTKSQKTVNIANKLTPVPTSPTVPKLTGTTTPTPIAVARESIPNSSIKDQYISFGIGSNQTDDWADISGSQVNIDFGNYQGIKEVRFEVSVSIPTANETASVRLFNVTDKHPVWYSEVTTTNNTYVVSQPIVHDNGIKTYQVQMKTQLKYLANLTLARIHITLQ